MGTNTTNYTNTCAPENQYQLQNRLELELFFSDIPEDWATISVLKHTYNDKTSTYVGIMCGHVTDRQQAIVFDEIDRILRNRLSHTGELITHIRDDTFYVNIIPAQWKRV